MRTDKDLEQSGDEEGAEEESNQPKGTKPAKRWIGREAERRNSWLSSVGLKEKQSTRAEAFDRATNASYSDQRLLGSIPICFHGRKPTFR